MKPKISVLICLYNSERKIRRCLDSVLNQDYKNFEVLCIEGGSTDKTTEIIKSYQRRDKRVNLVSVNSKLPEGKGNKKWFGFKKAKGEIVCIIDDDNEFQDKKVLSKVAEIMAKENNYVGLLGAIKHDIKDKKVVRFVSLGGYDPFFSYRSPDFIRLINKRELSDKESYEILKIFSDNVPLTGGNCFFYRKKDIMEIGGYNQDVLVIKKLAKKGKNKLLILKDATKHYAAENIPKLSLRIIFGQRAYYNKPLEERFNYLPQTKKERRAFIKNLFYNLLILPNLINCSKIYIKNKDAIILFFPIVSFINTIGHALNFIRDKTL